MSGEKIMYDADYYLRGKQTGKSLYENYRWMPELTKPMMCSMVSHLGIEPDDTILDFGCARGYTVRAFREAGYNAWGCDQSQWAINNCDKTVEDFLYWGKVIYMEFDWIIAKDVLEHIEDISYTMEWLKTAGKGIFAIVPLAHSKEYDVPEYEKDITHIHRRPLSWWVSQFHQPGWSVEARYRVKGIKDNYSQFPTGNGFITCRRLD
jgi:cyclopropane fatty-acyl-phospholipid synthase-like methyltransferase